MARSPGPLILGHTPLTLLATIFGVLLGSELLPVLFGSDHLISPPLLL